MASICPSGLEDLRNPRVSAANPLICGSSANSHLVIHGGPNHRRQYLHLDLTAVLVLADEHTSHIAERAVERFDHTCLPASFCG